VPFVVPPIAPPVLVKEILDGVPLFREGRVRSDYIDAVNAQTKAHLAVISNLTGELDEYRRSKVRLELGPGPLAYYSNFIKSQKVPVKSRRVKLDSRILKRSTRQSLISRIDTQKNPKRIIPRICGHCY
jgi:hypothetical protein